VDEAPLNSAEFRTLAGSWSVTYPLLEEEIEKSIAKIGAPKEHQEYLKR
jgi:hypothetical protein